MDNRRWRIEEGTSVMRDVVFRHFSEQNGYLLNDRCRIGNMAIGHLLRFGDKAVFRVA